MKILLSGVGTINKGAELMLYAILQEIERKHPHAIVYIPNEKINQGLSYIKTRLNIRFLPGQKMENRFRLNSVYRKLKIPYMFMPSMISIGHIDYYFDASGFKFSDQFFHSHISSELLNRYLIALKKQGTKIIYLPQAFGPFEKEESKEVLSVLNHSATVFMPREQVSYNYLQKSGIVDMKKVKTFPDFTTLVNGKIPEQYKHLKDGICIIPNMQMINKGAISFENYLILLKHVIDKAKKTGRTIFLLNHEGKKDEELCVELKKRISGELELVKDISALEIKGLISSAYLVISSRYHGVASSLSSCVPCLATSWSHKYKELFDDYDMPDCILPIDNIEKAIAMIYNHLHPEMNQLIRNRLSQQVKEIKEKNYQMWNYIWAI